ncbi:hypothetical protein [Empedobacter brevis]
MPMPISTSPKSPPAMSFGGLLYPLCCKPKVDLLLYYCGLMVVR